MNIRHSVQRTAFSSHCISNVVVLAFLWTVGLVCGVYFAANNSSFSALMRTVPLYGVSIVGLIAVLFLPLTLSIISVFYSVPFLIYGICLFRAVSTGYCIYGIAAGFGSAGWLMRILLLFSDTSMSVMLFWFWLRHLAGRNGFLSRDAIVCTVIAAVLGILDHSLVSPFLTALMGYL